VGTPEKAPASRIERVKKAQRETTTNEREKKRRGRLDLEGEYRREQ